MISFNLHSILRGDSKILGALILLLFTGVKFVSLNLSISLPDLTPQKSACLTKALLTRLITYSPLSLISLYESKTIFLSPSLKSKYTL